MSSLPRDMEEEVLSRVPVKSVREVRSTCKTWNSLTKDESFVVAKKKQRKQGIEVVMMVEHRVSLMSVDLLSPSIERIGNLNANGVYNISQIFHCDGLYLCYITKYNKHSFRLLLWNPFLGQTRWIEPTSCYHIFDKYALGYDKEKKEHKVLRFLYNNERSIRNRVCEFEMYSLHSNSWKVIYDFTWEPEPNWYVPFRPRGLTLKGNTYWYAQAVDGPPKIVDRPDFLRCFDYTSERFGPRLPLPFHAVFQDTISLSSVREEQLVVLFQERRAPAMTVKIWITSKIAPNAVSWSNLFLAVDMNPLIGIPFPYIASSFFLDEDNKVAVILDKDICKSDPPTRNIAHIIGDNGYFKQVDLGESRDRVCWPLVCSYVQSSVQIAPP